MIRPLFTTARLRVVPLTADAAGAALRDRDLFAELVGAKVPDAWPLPDMARLLPGIERELRVRPGASQLGGVIVTLQDPTVIGEIAFHAPANEQGSVEVGYSVIPEARRRGYATEATRGLVEWGLARPGIHRVIGRCERANEASRRVLEKAGLTFCGDDGRLLMFEILREGVGH